MIGVLKMKAKVSHVILFGLMVLILEGCAGAISKQTRETAIRHIGPESILLELENYEGKLVLMGGRIVETENREDGTVVKILQGPLSRYDDRPMDPSGPKRYFLVRYADFRDPELYRKGREITVAGTVAGKEVSKVDGIEQTHLMLQNRETHIWPHRRNYYWEPPRRTITRPPPGYPRTYWHPSPYWRYP
ncbi:MAG: hypothetical protein GTO12_14050 [Proteobacteria bacterium]|nr:hypothetical protein [Pseudomonadota bacterium]